MILQMFLFIGLTFFLFQYNDLLAQEIVDDVLTDQFIQTLDQTKIQDNFKYLSLTIAMSQGLSVSYDENIRYDDRQIVDLELKTVWSNFWLPNAQLSLTTTPHHITYLNGRKYNSQVPVGSFGLELNEFTLFNWGKDHLNYLNQKEILNRKKAKFDEDHRHFKHELILAYFQLLTYNEIERVRRQELRQASFIYRFNKERLGVQKISKQEFLLSRDQYLKAQSHFFEIKNLLKVSDEQMAFLLKDPQGTRYSIEETINFKRLNLTLDEALSSAQKANPSVLDSESTLLQSKRKYELALKENLPLPKITMDLGAYRYYFGPDLGDTSYGNTTGESLEAVATINATWDLFGGNGFLNSRKRTTALLEHHQSKIQLERDQHSAMSFVRQYFQRIEHAQTQVEILQAKTSNLTRAMHLITNNYMKGSSDITTFKTYLEEFTESEIQLRQYKYDHLKNKVLLAQVMGTYDFPGEKFDHLAKKETD